MLQNLLFKRLVAGTKVDIPGIQGAEVLVVSPDSTLAIVPKGPNGSFLRADVAGLESVVPPLNGLALVADEAARLALPATLGRAVRQSDNGVTYWFTGSDPSNPSDWTPIGDTEIISDDIVGLLQPNKLANGTPNNSTFLNGVQQWVPLKKLLNFASANTGASTLNPSVNTSYLVANPTNQQAFSLPSTPQVGDVIEVIGNSELGWIINNPVGHDIRFGEETTAISVSSTSRYDAVTLTCVLADAGNYTWQVTSAATSYLLLAV